MLYVIATCRCGNYKYTLQNNNITNLQTNNYTNANMDKLSQKKYEKQWTHFKRIKTSGLAIARAREDFRNFAPWDDTSDEGKAQRDKMDLPKVTSLSNVVPFFFLNYLGGMSALQKDVFTVEYLVYNDLTRDVRMDENTQSINVRMYWENWEVRVALYHGTPSLLPIPSYGATAGVHGANDRDRLAKELGFSIDSIRKASTADMNNLERLLMSGAEVQNKLTRLVKGYLLYLDIASGDPLFVNRDNDLGINVIDYTPHDIANAYSGNDSQYVYTSMPQSPVHNYVCLVMGEAWPNRDSRMRHVFVPADGPTVRLVAKSDVNISSRCLLKAHTVLESVHRYARDFSVTNQLEEAFTIAASLYSNKYLTEVQLPQVVSKVDLIGPVFRGNDEAPIHLPSFSAEFGKVVGRLHQLSMFSQIKDLVMAAKNSTKSGYMFHNTVASYVSQKSLQLKRIASHELGLPMLELTPSMLWLECLDSGDYTAIDATSGLEALWACNRSHTGLTGGLYHLLRRGEADHDPANANVAALVDEAAKCNIQLRRDQIPNSSFSVEGIALVVDEKRRSRGVTREATEFDPILECKHNPPRAIQKARRGRPANEATSTETSESLPVSPIRSMKQTNVLRRLAETLTGTDDDNYEDTREMSSDGYDMESSASISPKQSKGWTSTVLSHVGDEVMSRDETKGSLLKRVGSGIIAAAGSIAREESRSRSPTPTPKKKPWKIKAEQEIGSGLTPTEKQALGRVLEPVTREDDLMAALKSYSQRPESEAGRSLLWRIHCKSNDKKAALAGWVKRHKLEWHMSMMSPKMVIQRLREGAFDIDCDAALMDMPENKDYENELHMARETIKFSRRLDRITAGEKLERKTYANANERAEGMRDEFDGNITEVTGVPMVSVVGSRPFKDYVSKQVPENMKVMGQPAHQTVAKFVAAGSSLPSAIAICKKILNTKMKMSPVQATPEQWGYLADVEPWTQKSQSAGGGEYGMSDAKLMRWALIHKLEGMDLEQMDQINNEYYLGDDYQLLKEYRKNHRRTRTSTA